MSARKIIGTPGKGLQAASLDELFLHPEGINVRALAGVNPDILEQRLNTPLRNLIRSRFMLFALANAGYKPALAAVEKIKSQHTAYRTEQRQQQVMRELAGTYGLGDLATNLAVAQRSPDLVPMTPEQMAALKRMVAENG